MFVSCSDDETIKVWGVSTKVKVEMIYTSGKVYKENVIKIDVKNEEQKKEDEGGSNRRTRSNRS